MYEDVQLFFILYDIWVWISLSIKHSQAMTVRNDLCSSQTLHEQRKVVLIESKKNNTCEIRVPRAHVFRTPLSQ